eukprot:CAMPEP_0202743188 /NCGR_PEP_ID=MMETSP1388-20130828/5614_1 /ASSEMBLY_ACC=CAM_ASM_000864 /TAXON_ID=37098 /ORGANISM="Isochrysis sp, Strain CCMP1244" /LENGTH=108 /DNA_ID=CAMNT_0049410187 /DNA_START=54 /DNA_END=377 /DNA_ORIENTATION=-
MSLPTGLSRHLRGLSRLSAVANSATALALAAPDQLLVVGIAAASSPATVRECPLPPDSAIGALAFDAVLPGLLFAATREGSVHAFNTRGRVADSSAAPRPRKAGCAYL